MSPAGEMSEGSNLFAYKIFNNLQESSIGMNVSIDCSNVDKKAHEGNEGYSINCS